MCKKDYVTMLYKKVQSEYDDFSAEMNTKPADEITQTTKCSKYSIFYK